MANNTKEIKRRIKSISSTLQVTKAMELISSVKMRKASQITLRSREFSTEVWQLIKELADENNFRLPALFRNNDSQKILLVLVASDKGQAGSYNANILRATQKHIASIAKDTDIDIITVGKKAAKISAICKNVNIISSFEMEEGFDFFEARPISKMIIESFLKGEYGKIFIAYTEFFNTLKQIAIVKQILPIRSQEINELGANQDDNITEYKFEPDVYSILNILSRLAVRSQIYQALQEASASEHSARMVAMKSATDNGTQLVSDLQFSFNKLRQQSITQEIAEISAGRIALSKK